MKLQMDDTIIQGARVPTLLNSKAACPLWMTVFETQLMITSDFRKTSPCKWKSLISIHPATNLNIVPVTQSRRPPPPPKTMLRCLRGMQLQSGPFGKTFQHCFKEGGRRAKKVVCGQTIETFGCKGQGRRPQL